MIRCTTRVPLSLTEGREPTSTIFPLSKPQGLHVVDEVFALFQPVVRPLTHELDRIDFLVLFEQRPHRLDKSSQLASVCHVSTHTLSPYLVSSGGASRRDRIRPVSTFTPQRQFTHWFLRVRVIKASAIG